MQPISLKFGEFLYREGDPSDAVYFIESGTVEVRRKVGPDEATVATLGKGEILGEMGVLSGEPRSASIIATSDVALVRLDSSEFMQAFGGPDGVGLKILRMICARLAASNVAFGAPIGPDLALRREVAEIRVLGDSRPTSRLLGNTGVVVKALPFEIGTTAGNGAIHNAKRLMLPLGQGDAASGAGRLRMELTHDGHIALRQQAVSGVVSVNGAPLKQSGEAALHIGDNLVIFGGERSVARLILRLRRARTVAA